MNYFDKIDNKVKEYFDILESDIPSWLIEYINTDAMLHQQYIGMSCGTIYSNLYKEKFFYSSLDHSIGVALITWHFTHDKIQTLASLFHDIATPVFKHSIDFLNNDYEKQESTEDLTSKIISDSKEIMSLLKRDNIKLEDVDNYHLYSICDNDTPRICADRLEYSLSNALLYYNLLDINQVRDIYNDLYIVKNEEGNDEIAFKTKKFARLLVKVTCIMSVTYRDDRTRYSMQLLADIVKNLVDDGIISINDLYNKKEIEIISIIKNSKYKDIFNTWVNANKVLVSDVEPVDVYYVHHGSKIRYVDPLVNNARVSNICKIAKSYIDKNLSYDMNKYVYIENIKI